MFFRTGVFDFPECTYWRIQVTIRGHDWQIYLNNNGNSRFIIRVNASYHTFKDVKTWVSLSVGQERAQDGMIVVYRAYLYMCCSHCLRCGRSSFNSCDLRTSQMHFSYFTPWQNKSSIKRSVRRRASACGWSLPLITSPLRQIYSDRIPKQNISINVDSEWTNDGR